MNRIPRNRRQPPPEEDADLKPLTPQQCKEVADSFKDLPPEFQLSQAELEEVQDEVFGERPYGSADEAISAMERRLESLTSSKRKALETMDRATEQGQEPAYQAALEALTEINAAIAKTKERLAQSIIQKEQEN